jgi:hypothetical protein
VGPFNVTGGPTTTRRTISPCRPARPGEVLARSAIERIGTLAYGGAVPRDVTRLMPFYSQVPAKHVRWLRGIRTAPQAMLSSLRSLPRQAMR